MVFVLRWEGGFVDHPADPGGATNKGVTQAVYDAWRTTLGQPKRSVRQIETAEVDAIYERNYWEAARCPQMPTPLDAVQFDTAVNMGVGRAVRFLQQSVGVGVDGSFGPGTAAAVARADLGATLVRYCEVREGFYRGIVERKPSQAVFLKGWLNRLNSLRKHAGLPGYESASDEIDLGDAPYMARVPDIDEPAGDF
jgi:lysozyme family protein